MSALNRFRAAATPVAAASLAAVAFLAPASESHCHAPAPRVAAHAGALQLSRAAAAAMDYGVALPFDGKPVGAVGRGSLALPEEEQALTPFAVSLLGDAFAADRKTASAELTLSPAGVSLSGKPLFESPQLSASPDAATELVARCTQLAAAAACVAEGDAQRRLVDSLARLPMLLGTRLPVSPAAAELCAGAGSVSVHGLDGLGAALNRSGPGPHVDVALVRAGESAPAGADLVITDCAAVADACRCEALVVPSLDELTPVVMLATVARLL